MGLFSRLFGSKETSPKIQPKKSPTTPHQPPKPTSSWEAATVKKYNPKKGFGFLTRGEGTQDVYIHRSTLKLCGLEPLQEGQRVEIRWAKVPKGLEAGDIRLLK